MDYETARYVALMLYAPNSNTQTLYAFKHFLAWFNNAISHIPLWQKGLAYYKKLDIRTLRKRQFKPDKAFAAWMPEISNAQEVVIYVYDDEWSEITAPRILANIHLSNTGEIDRFKLRLGDLVIDQACFMMIAIRSDVVSDIKERLYERLQLLFDQAEGIRGKLWYETPYFIKRARSPYGKTPLEWAHKNVSQELPDGDIEHWDLEADKDLFR